MREEFFYLHLTWDDLLLYVEPDECLQRFAVGRNAKAKEAFPEFIARKGIQVA